VRIKTNGIKYFIAKHQEEAAKVNLILLHGFMGSGKIFDQLIPHLKSFCNPITIDLLGHGKTEEAPSAERFYAKKQTRDLAEIIPKIDTPPSFLYGYSMGGRLALQFSAAHPEMLKGLILESTNPGLAAKKERTERRMQDKKRAHAIEEDFNAFLEKWKQLPLFKDTTADKNVLHRYYEIQKQNQPEQLAMSLRGFGTGQMPFVNVEKIALPVLLLAGSNDEKYVNVAKKMNAQNSESLLRIISNAGHRIHLEQPARILPQIQKFIKSKSGR